MTKRGNIGHFKLINKDSSTRARTAVLTTAHGDIKTPVFMPVGTRGTVKGLLPSTIEQTSAQIILANTYHMVIRPGVDVVESLGGLHNFMGWDKPILTDSGGFQVFSLDSLNRVDDDGVWFNSHIDGKKIYLSPETATKAQNKLGADIIMCFDECAVYPCKRETLKKVVERTIKWAEICKNSHQNTNQLLFGIIQGGIDSELRHYCSEKMVEIDFPGYAIGGLSVGEGHENMIKTVDFTTKLLPEDKPRYLMGVGTPADIVAAVRAGVDMFDCVLPTRNGRNGTAFTSNGQLKMRNSAHILDSGPVEEGCDCYCCRKFTRAAVRHFFNVGEMLGPILLSIHNIRYFQRLTETMRQEISENTFGSWSEAFLKRYEKS